VAGHDQWSLIKLHGSVDWVREIQNPLGRGAVHGLLQNVSTLVDGELALSDEIQVIRRPDVEATRRPEAGVFNFPALSVPLGPEDELNCPPFHVAHLQERLAAQDGLHILVVGYSGLDSALLRLLRESGNTLRSLFVVNHSEDAAFTAAEHIASALQREADTSMAAPETFADFANGAPLDNYFARLD
jgi:hypothetical protein